MADKAEWVKAKVRGLTIFLNGQALSSRHDPVEEGKRLFGPVAGFPERPILFLGMPPMYHILLAARENRDFWIADARPFLQREGAGLLSHLADEEKVSSAPAHFWKSKIISSSTPEDLLARLGERIDDFGKILVVEGSLGSADEAVRRFHGDFWKVFKISLLENARKKQTEHHFAPRWIRNALKNNRCTGEISLLSDLSLKSGNSLPDTALLISSGLSVERDLPKLAKISRSLPTFILPGVFPLLQKNHVLVDAVISTDGGYYNTCHFEALWRSGFKGPLIAPFSIYPGVPEAMSRTVFYFDDVELLKILGLENAEPPEEIQKNWIPMAGSAVTNALTIMKKLGFGRVVSAGLDFALTPFKFHAISNITEERFFAVQDRFKPFETLYRGAFSSRLVALEGPDPLITHTDDKLRLYRRLALAEAARLGIQWLPYENWNQKDTHSKSFSLEQGDGKKSSEAVRNRFARSRQEFLNFFQTAGSIQSPGRDYLVGTVNRYFDSDR